MTEKPMSTFDAAMIMDGEWELSGYEPSEETFVVAAQHLIDTGAVLSLQGRIQRTCQDLIDDGRCTLPGAAA